VENPKRALIMFGNKTSQVVKDVLTDFHKMKGVSKRRLALEGEPPLKHGLPSPTAGRSPHRSPHLRRRPGSGRLPALSSPLSRPRPPHLHNLTNLNAHLYAPTPPASTHQEDSVKFSRRNADVRPFEAGGEVELEKHTGRQDCSLFAVGSHSKKRPHNLTLGRMYDGRLYDAVELGVTAIKRLTSFAAASRPQLGNKVRRVFALGRGGSFGSNFGSFGAGRLSVAGCAPPLACLVACLDLRGVSAALTHCSRAPDPSTPPHTHTCPPSLQPCFLFSGDGFESDPALRQVKSLFLDFFRGRQVDRVNLAGLDRVLQLVADPRSPGRLLLRQYAARYKKSGESLGKEGRAGRSWLRGGRTRSEVQEVCAGPAGGAGGLAGLGRQAPWAPPHRALLSSPRFPPPGTKIPRAELTEMGPSLDLELRRCKAAPIDLEREATRKPKLTKKKARRGLAAPALRCHLRLRRAAPQRRRPPRCHSPPARRRHFPFHSVLIFHIFTVLPFYTFPTFCPRRSRTWAATSWTARSGASTCRARRSTPSRCAR
jgi:hypothetical protein